jgi:hypothetical protein
VCHETPVSRRLPRRLQGDLLHWLCTESILTFSRLIYVPMLTPDDPRSAHGRTPHSLFPCRPHVHDFVVSLGVSPHDLNRVRKLGGLDARRIFEVVLEPGDSQHVGQGPQRAEYWRNLPSRLTSDSLLFLDPDNGLETKTRRAAKWVRHGELANLLRLTQDSGGLLVYQHRPQRRGMGRSLPGSRRAGHVLGVRRGGTRSEPCLCHHGVWTSGRFAPDGNGASLLQGTRDWTRRLLYLHTRSNGLSAIKGAAPQTRPAASPIADDVHESGSSSHRDGRAGNGRPDREWVDRRPAAAPTQAACASGVVAPHGYVGPHSAEGFFVIDRIVLIRMTGNTSGLPAGRAGRLAILGQA